MERTKDDNSFCKRVSLAQAKTPSSFLSQLEEVIAKRPIRPGRKELKKRDQPLKKNVSPNKKQKSSFKKVSKPQKTNSGSEEGAPPKADVKKGNIDQYGRFSLKDVEDEEATRETDLVPVNDQEEDDDFEIPSSRANPKLTAVRSIGDPQLYLINFRKTEDLKTFLQQTKPSFNPANVVELFSGSKNDTELSQFFAYIVSRSKSGDFENKIKNVPHDTQALPEDFLSYDAPFDNLDFGPEFKSLEINETKVRRTLNQLFSQLQSESQGGQVSALRMMSEIPIDYIRFLNPKLSPREFYVGGNPPNAGTKGSRLVLCDEEESRRFLKVMEYFKPLNPFFTDLYYVNDIDPDFKDFEPFKIIPARALILEAKTKFKLNEEVELDGGKVEIWDAASNQHVKATQEDLLLHFVEENMHNVAKRGTWRKMRYYEGDNWIHFNRDYTKAILWGSRTKALSLNKKDILESLPFVKNVNLTFIK